MSRNPVQTTPRKFRTMTQREAPEPVVVPPPPPVKPFHKIRSAVATGELCEALQVTEETPAGEQTAFRQEYQLRRDLVELSFLPEGYVFTHRSKRVTLLTPPDMIAVQRKDGTWYRTSRPEDPASPLPYTKAWYRKYLRAYGLPLWFLRPAHLSMLHDNLESELLEVKNAPTNTLTAPSDYLSRTYPSPVKYIKPREFGREVYAHALWSIEDEHRTYLARQFPAVKIPDSIFDYRTVILPSRHVQLQTYDAEDKPEEEYAVVEDDEVKWYEDGEKPSVASYSIEGTDMEVQLANAQVPDPRRSLVQTAVDAGGVVNARPELLGTYAGTWAYLSDEDRELANSMAYNDLASVVKSRARGYLPSGLDASAGPLVVFTPDSAFLNPPTRPQGPGYWRYLTTGIHSSEEVASVSLGRLYGFSDQPTASQVWRLRKVLEKYNMVDTTEGIDLLWVPGKEDGVEEGEAPVFEVGDDWELESEEQDGKAEAVE